MCRKMVRIFLEKNVLYMISIRTRFRTFFRFGRTLLRYVTYVRLLSSQFRLSSVVCPWRLWSLRLNFSATYCSVFIWLDCEENRAKTFAPVLQGVVVGLQGWYTKNRDFRPVSRFTSQTIQNVPWKTNSNSYVIYRILLLYESLKGPIGLRWRHVTFGYLIYLLLHVFLSL